MPKSTPKPAKELSLESVLWNCRVVLRNKCNKPTNRDAVLALIFLKFAGDKFEKRRQEIIAEEGDVPIFLEKPSFYLAANVFYLNETSRWSYIVKNASADKIAVMLDQAMADIEDKNESLKGALPQRFFSSLAGVNSKDIKSLIDEINKISEERFHEKDLIGRVYEYFLQQFAMDEAKEKGEFYTPKAIVNLIAELIEPYKGRIYDPCCGSGGMFVQSLKFVESHHGNKSNISIFGQESDPDTYRLAKMNLAIRGISNNLGDKNASSFTDDRQKDLKVDFIMANPPFNLKNWRGENELTSDPRWSGYGTPPVSNANYAWILHMLSKLDVSNGIAGFLLANGALGAGTEEYNIRKQLIENDKIEAIIVLPREMFYSTDISVTLWILNNNKKDRTLNKRKLRNRQNEVLFIDLRTWNKNVYEKSYVTFDDAQIAAVRKIYTDWQSTERGYKNISELCKSAKIADIRKNDYTLVPSKYIKFIDHDLDIDYKKEMTRIQKKMKEILKEERKSQKMLESAFKGIGYGIE
ncbi:type I restriction endonuclease subunit M [Spirochaetia bacterium]|nr:type I restriction endonuclease subunit M [Spirochaetia bacterium]